jgi:hypothetical protein
MRKFLTAIGMFLLFTAAAQERDMAFLYTSRLYNDSNYHTTSTANTSTSLLKNDFADFNLVKLVAANKPAKKTLGYTRKKKPVEVYYFPGTSTKKAVVIGGVHGSELSAVEVARQLINQLAIGEKPYYSVMIIPTLFPDNAAKAEACKTDRVMKNEGRYTHEEAIDPNRQLPPLGAPFNWQNPVDAFGREMEIENQLLLQLIQAFGPNRIVNLHAIRDYGKAGIYADPRTDCEGRALGFATDSTLAVLMANYVHEKGGNVAGNKITSTPTALYYLDPKPAAAGEMQQRNLTGTNRKGKISGVSLGSWAATAVCDEANNYQRAAMRILTVEFPGYKKPSEYQFREDKKWYTDLVKVYASSIYHYFLQEFCVEQINAEEKSLVLK